MAFTNYENLLNDNILKKGSITRDLNKKIMNFTSRKSVTKSLLPGNIIKISQNNSSKIT
jgi:hypothetical protein